MFINKHPNTFKHLVKYQPKVAGCPISCIFCQVPPFCPSVNYDMWNICVMHYEPEASLHIDITYIGFSTHGSWDVLTLAPFLSSCKRFSQSECSKLSVLIWRSCWQGQLRVCAFLCVSTFLSMYTLKWRQHVWACCFVITWLNAGFQFVFILSPFPILVLNFLHLIPVFPVCFSWWFINQRLNRWFNLLKMS